MICLHDRRGRRRAMRWTKVPTKGKGAPRKGATRLPANMPQQKLVPKPMTPVTPSQKEKFLKLLRSSGNVARCAEACGHYRGTFYQLRQPEYAAFDPEFTKLWDEAVEAHTDDLEEEGFRRAFGEHRPVLNKNTGKQLMIKDEHGKLVPLTKKQASDLLLIFMLKGNRKRYVDRPALEGEGAPPDFVANQVKELLMAKLFPPTPDPPARQPPPALPKEHTR